MGGFLLGLLIGLAIGAGAVYLFVRRPSPAAGSGAVTAETELAAPVAVEPPASAPSPAPAPPAPAAAPPPPDDDVKQALDATKGLLDELEGRYRGRTAPAEGEEGPKPRRRTKKPPTP